MEEKMKAVLQLLRAVFLQHEKGVIYIFTVSGRGNMEVGYVGYESVWNCLKVESLLGTLLGMVFLREGLEVRHHEQVIHEEGELHFRK